MAYYKRTNFKLVLNNFKNIKKKINVVLKTKTFT